MRITSQLAAGTRVELWLPVAGAERIAAVRPERPRTIVEMRSCRVLVVDDDPIVLSGTAAMLEDLGHVPTEVASGYAALEALRSARGFDLVIADHAMPGMTGTELAGHIRRGWPKLPIVIATGFAELPGDSDLVLPRLSKPYRQQDLAEMVAELIGEGQLSHGPAD
jgi:CheY-like chemotaxis protein